MASNKEFEKATKFESQKRVTRVIEWQLAGFTSFEIVQKGSAEWGIGERMVRKYIAKANNEIFQSMEQTQRHHFLAQKLHQLDGCIALSLKQNQPAAAVAAIQAQCKLTGIGNAIVG